MQKVQQCMYMIRHKNIACDADVLRIQIIKPFVNSIVGIGELKQRKPVITGEGYKVNAVRLLFML